VTISTWLRIMASHLPAKAEDDEDRIGLRPPSAAKQYVAALLFLPPDKALFNLRVDLV
jgi:hypothetical protein